MNNSEPCANLWSGRYFFVCQLEIVSYFSHELKQRSSDITGRHYRLVDSDVTEGSKRLEVMSEIQQGHYKQDQSNETIFEQLSSS